MARPIFIIRIPTSVIEKGQRDQITAALNDAPICEEYLVTLVPNTIDEWFFEVLSVEGMEPSTMEDLENKILKLHEDITKKINLN